MYPFVITTEDFNNGLNNLLAAHNHMISDSEINDPEEGEKVCFMPDHVDSTSHKDAEYGVVTNVGNAGIMVDFNDGSGVSKLCYRRHLLRVGSTTNHPEV